jgi:NAD(P)-dependent dehydrogenase (short-subunit alcohol dehydrogenase family)
MKPMSYVFDGIFWIVVLLVGAPVASVGVLAIAIYKLLAFVAKLLGYGCIKPNSNAEQKLAVVVTGCDTGFGHDLAFALMKEGFVVFCCCLRKESFKAFENQALAVPLLMDVTKDDDVEKASKRVIDWLSGDDGRYLHALVNNAGIGISGSVDLLPVTEFQKMMDVNYFGMVRCCKMFLPLFKFQAATGFYTDARIVNVVSMAGMISGVVFMVGYEASKHAADLFTNNLRLETRGFGIQVTAVNPSFHRTPLTATMSENMKAMWKSLPEEKRREYGKGTTEFAELRRFPNCWLIFSRHLLSPLLHTTEYLEDACIFSEFASSVFNWDRRHVVTAMLNSVTAKRAPARVMVGFDAKYIFILLHILPAWVTSRITPLRNLERPAMMT